jgi:phage terminase large subunit-like protein
MPRNKPRPSTYLPRRFPWLTGNKTRAERVIAFLEYLPITKGILRGKKMRLLPHQRDLVQRIYAEDVSVRLAVSSVARGNGKTGLVAGLVCWPHVRP